MISASDLIKQYHSSTDIKDDDMVNVERHVMKAAAGNYREITYGILTNKYSSVMNNLKELGYKVSSESSSNNITVLKISW